MTPIFGDVFTEIAVLLLMAAVIGAIGVRLRQPLIVAFIAGGILVGPSVLGWVSADDQVDLLAKLGIALLLLCGVHTGHIRTYAVNRIEKGSHLTRGLEQINTPGVGHVPFDQSGKLLVILRVSRTKYTCCSNYYLFVRSI